MRNQVKVTGTRMYTDPQGNHVVCIGKLVLINTGRKDYKFGNLITSTPQHDGNKTGGRELHTVDSLFMSNNNPELWDIVEPLIISENEKIIDSEGPHYSSRWNDVHAHAHRNIEDTCCKILAWPHHFSQNHLDAIGDKKMRAGDKVYIECTNQSNSTGNGIPYEYEIALNLKNNIKLFPIVKHSISPITAEKSLLGDYKRRLVTITEELRKLTSNCPDNEKNIRLNTKASCYRTIIAELNREISQESAREFTGYSAFIGKEKVFVVADNIAEALDKLEEISDGEGVSMDSHGSIRFIS